MPAPASRPLAHPRGATKAIGARGAHPWQSAALVKGATAPIPRWGGRRAARLTEAVLARDYDPEAGYTPCRWCAGRATTADHYPLGRDEGGPDTLDNLVASCRPCNSARGAAYVNAKRLTPPGPSREW